MERRIHGQKNNNRVFEQFAFDTYMVDDIGKTVFLTKEEATEQSLKQMGE